jgi:hypothetical protein
LVERHGLGSMPDLRVIGFAASDRRKG